MPLANLFGLFSKPEPEPTVHPSELTQDYIQRHAREQIQQPKPLSDNHKKLIDAAAFVISVMDKQQGLSASAKGMSLAAQDRIFVGFKLEDDDMSMSFDCYLYITDKDEILLTPLAGSTRVYNFSKPDGRKAFYDRFAEFYAEHLSKKASKELLQAHYQSCLKQRTPRASSPMARFRNTPK